MSTEHDEMPESNVDDIATNLWSRSIDLTGQGLVDVLQTLVSRAEEIRDKRAAAMEASNKWMDDVASLTPEAIQIDAYEGFFEPQCLKWFIGRVCRHLAEEMEFGMEGHQVHGKRFAKIDYAPDGTVSSYILGN